MKIEVHLPEFKKMIGIAERVAKKNASLPVLSCLVFEVMKNTLVIRSTNLDVGVEMTMPAKTEASGTVAVPAHTISAFISQLADQDGVVKIELVSGNLHIISMRSKVIIKTVPHDDFPSIPKISDGKETKTPTDIFMKGLKSVWYSASVSSIKPELSSVYVYKNNEHLIFAATDSFRLAEKKVKIPTTADLEDVLIPFKNIPDIMRTLEGIGAEVTVRSNKNLISFEAGGTRITSRIVDGTFPDYRQIIPKNYSTEAVALKQDVMTALKVSTVFADKFNQIKLVIDPKGKIFEVQTKNADVGENATAIDAALSGEKVEINFNGKYIADCFQSIDADSVSFQLGGLNKPMVVRPAAGDGTFMYLVMPMNR